MKEKPTGKSSSRTEDSRISSIHLRKLAQKIFDTGAEAVHITREELRTLVELNPRDAVGVVVENLMKGTDQLQTILVREAQRYLNAIDMRDEVGKILANYTIEVQASINFVPREKASVRRKDKRAATEGSENSKLEAENFKIELVSKEGKASP